MGPGVGFFLQPRGCSSRLVIGGGMGKLLSCSLKLLPKGPAQRKQVVRSGRSWDHRS